MLRVKRLWQRFLEVPLFVWVIGVLVVCVPQTVIDTAESGPLIWLLYGVSWFLLLATIASAVAVLIRLVMTRGRGVASRQLSIALAGLLLVGFIAVQVTA